MNIKTISIIVAVLVIGAIGYFAYMQNSASTTTTGTEETAAGADAPQGKLNINVVCDGALAYMTFSDGAAAEKFVAECKEGKHPEVIEKYKADMNLGEGAAI